MSTLAAASLARTVHSIALERIQIPKETSELLAELIKPGSSFIISDYGLSRETSARTEFGLPILKATFV